MDKTRIRHQHLINVIEKHEYGYPQIINLAMFTDCILSTDMDGMITSANYAFLTEA